jgi:hypothetical protein
MAAEFGRKCKTDMLSHGRGYKIGNVFVNAFYSVGLELEKRLELT